MASTDFKRTVEDFVCEHCGKSVSGNGYTNHCPQCLWSKHVDVFPGDRAEMCGGAMKPVSFLKNGQKYVLLQQCQSCGHERSNKFLEGVDSFDTLLSLVDRKGEGF
ncbi:MAG: RNHCP domain-containing protein [Candidatus Moranbacteria bacterium]|nr:RNHCP domain-containing protein [Candidatus Moranbacteria bacterium]